MILFYFIILLLLATMLMLILAADFIQVRSQDSDNEQLYDSITDNEVSSNFKDFKLMKYLQAIELAEKDSRRNSQGDPSYSNIELTLKGLNKELKLNLITLVYIFKMESKLKSNNSHDEMKTISEIKSRLRLKTLQITRAINLYKSLQTSKSSEPSAA